MVAFVLLAACSTPGAVRLTNADNNRSISLKKGETFEIALKANHSTGYQWVWQDSSSRVVEQYQPARYDLESSGDGRVGAGGVEYWSFRAKESGKETIRLSYRRPWESSAAPAEEFRVEVAVE